MARDPIQYPDICKVPHGGTPSQADAAQVPEWIDVTIALPGGQAAKVRVTDWAARLASVQLQAAGAAGSTIAGLDGKSVTLAAAIAANASLGLTQSASKVRYAATGGASAKRVAEAGATRRGYASLKPQHIAERVVVKAREEGKATISLDESALALVAALSADEETADVALSIAQGQE